MKQEIHGDARAVTSKGSAFPSWLRASLVILAVAVSTAIFVFGFFMAVLSLVSDLLVVLLPLGVILPLALLGGIAYRFNARKRWPMGVGLIVGTAGGLALVGLLSIAALTFQSFD